MSLNNEEDNKFPSASYDNENESLNTYFSNENNNPFMYRNSYLNDFGNDEPSIFNPQNLYPIFPENIEGIITQDNPIIDNEIIDTRKKFNVLLKRGRGPKPKNECLKMKRHRHLNTHYDNLQIKIQVHFINFIINLSNDVLFSIFRLNKKYNFKDIDHSFKIDVSRKNFDYLKSSKIKDILAKKISIKYTKYNENNNEEVLNEVCQKSAWLNDFFNLNYLDVFKCYYNDQNQMDQISFCGQVITLSKKTKNKTFYELLIKNENIKKELINAVKNAYFNGKDPNCPKMDENIIESK